MGVAPLAATWLALGAWGQESEAEREAELFGDPAAPAPAPAPPAEPAPSPEPTSLEDALFGAPTATAPSDQPAPEATIADKIREQDRTFELGGRLWLRLDGQLYEGADGADDVDLSSPNLLELFADARPNDRVRAYARGRLQHDWTVHQTFVDPSGATIDAVTGEPVEPSLFGAPAAPSEVVLDQLWVKFDVRRKVYATVGRQRVKWGSGRFWNPTDFLNQQRLDPLAVLDLRTGVSLVRLHVPFEAAGGNVYAIANLDQATALDEIGGAGRVEWLVGQTELTASAAVRKDQPLRLGADLSSGVSVLDVRVEAAVQHGHADPAWRGRWDYTVVPPVFPTERDRDDAWIPQVVVGADVSARYSAQDSVTFGAEFFANDAGTADTGLYPWLLVTGGFTPLYVGRHYLAGYALLPGPGRWDDHSFTASFIGNLTDRSEIARLDYRGNALTWLDVNLFVARSFGQPGELHLALDLPAMPAPVAALCATDPACAPYAELLASPIRAPAPTTSFGSGLAVRF